MARRRRPVHGRGPQAELRGAATDAPAAGPVRDLAVRPSALALLAVALVVSAILTVRMLGLPWWWLAFPPLVECVITGNAHGLLLPLMLGGRGWLAILLKVYAAVPLAILGQWRQLFLAALRDLVTIPILPWEAVHRRSTRHRGALRRDSRARTAARRCSCSSCPLALVAFLIVGREKAAWMAVPALWPSPQPYYSTLAMPTRSAAAAGGHRRSRCPSPDSSRCSRWRACMSLQVGIDGPADDAAGAPVTRRPGRSYYMRRLARALRLGRR